MRSVQCNWSFKIGLVCGLVGPVANLQSINRADVKNAVDGIHASITGGVALSSTGGM